MSKAMLRRDKGGYANAQLLIERAEALGERLEDPLILFSVLYGVWVGQSSRVQRRVMRELATQFLDLAKSKGQQLH